MKAILLSILLFSTATLPAVENSIIPTMESFERVENLPASKFTTRQLRGIAKALEHKDDKIRLVTYNMLFNVYDHNLDPVNRWPERLPRIVKLMNEVRPDIISTQELYPSQLLDVINEFGEEFAFFHGQKNENSESYAIFYRKSRFQLLSSQFDYPLASVELKDLKTKKTVTIFNTHMPLANIEKREANARKIVKMIEPLAKHSAAIFTGDLNTFTARLELNFPFYDGDYIHRILSKGSLRNSQDLSLLGHFGPISTFTNKDPETHAFMGTGTPGVILDYIYVSPQVTVLTHAVEPGTVDGHFPSDHMPLLIDLIIK